MPVSLQDRLVVHAVLTGGSSGSPSEVTHLSLEAPAYGHDSPSGARDTGSTK